MTYIKGFLTLINETKQIYLPKAFMKKAFYQHYFEIKKILALLLAMPNPGVCIAKSNPRGGHWSEKISNFAME
jgi:hypothetical protein